MGGSRAEKNNTRTDEQPVEVTTEQTGLFTGKEHGNLRVFNSRDALSMSNEGRKIKGGGLFSS